MAASTEQPRSKTQESVFQWLRNLPLAPEYHPTLAEFQDPIAYIFKIEKEASKYGICKIVPPHLPASRKSILSNLNKSLLSRPGSTSPPTFTTRQQQIGFCPRRPRPVQKPVWQSGESYTFQDFEAKAKGFEKSYLKKYSKRQTLSSSSLSPLEVETLYWKAAVDKPFSVEYANDMPGSAFPPGRRKEGVGVVAEGVSVGDTEWNMIGASRAKGSLLRFMKEEIPGVTSPMVYIGMMFSWFAWHVEDHDLHSLNYMHMGAGKTWYGVPRDAAAAFEEVVRVHGYEGEINPVVTFSVLGKKTTVMSPEVFITAGVPCCRLVQNAGEFVVTFPRAYHCGFSHGFNCSEAANIATPEWLSVAKDAAIRRASISYPPMVSHLQLLYDLALELCTRVPASISSKPRSSRLKDKQKGEGEAFVKEQFVNNIISNNDLLHILGKGSSVVLLPQSSSNVSVCSNLRVGSQLKDNPSFGLYSDKDFENSPKSTVPSTIVPEGNHRIKQVKGFSSIEANFDSLYGRNRFASLNVNTGTGKSSDIHCDKLSDQRLFSCVTCGILSFDCVAVIQPSEAASQYLMSADCSFFNDWTFGTRVPIDGFAINGGNENASHQKPSARQMEKNVGDVLYDVPVQSVYQIHVVDQSIKMESDSAPHNGPSALGLLALNYGNSSDSEEEQLDADASLEIEQINRTNCPDSYHPQDSAPPSYKEECHDDATCRLSSSRLNHEDVGSLQPIGYFSEHGSELANIKNRSDQNVDCILEHVTVSTESNDLGGARRDPMSSPSMVSECSPGVQGSERTKSGRAIIPPENTNITSTQKSDDDSSRMHAFCLEHAVEVEQRLQKIGGVNVWLLCHPEYPRIETEARSVSEELGGDHLWNDITFRAASKEDEERIKSTLDSEEAIQGNGDWAVKLGINLFHSANLSRSPLYSKQMPYNSVIYNAFGRTSPSSSPTKINVYGRRRSRQKVVAGKWCGKVWMSNQVHPFLSKQDSKGHEQELVISSHGQAMSNEKLVRKPKNSPKSESSLVTRKYARKRKVTAGSGSAKNSKCIEKEDPASGDSMEDDLHKLGPRTINGNRTKAIDRDFSRDSSDDDCQQQERRICKSKTHIERENDTSEDSSGENLNLQYRRILRDKRARLNADSFVAEKNSQKQQVTAHRSNEDNYFEERSVSDDLLLNTLRQWRGRFPRIKQAKFVENEELSDDLLEGSQETKCIEKKKDRFSDDSLENMSSQRKRRISRDNKAKHTDMEHAFSDDSPDESTRQHKGFPRGKQAKLMESEDAVMDDYMNDNTYHQHTRILRSKQTRYIEMEDVDPDTGPPSKAPRSRNTQFSMSEDAVSDDLLEEQTQQHRKSSRGKKGKAVQKDVVDNLQQNSRQQLKKTPRGNQTEFNKTEDTVSADLKDTSNQQQKRVLRSSHNKQITLRQLKQEASRMIKKGTPQSIKLEKQEKPQLQMGKSQPNTRHLESQVEGGPSTRLRRRPSKPQKVLETKPKMKQQSSVKKETNALPLKAQAGHKNVKIKDEGSFHCDIEGCTMGFRSKQELATHKKNVCPVKGCAKKFFSHKYLLQHRRVHIDDRPLKCPWKGCKMSFKWAWARTEHIRVHTGERPYVCAEDGCGQTFRFVSDFSRHKRKTGHSVRKPTRC